jgi:D-aminoacyl-tRNA deacylase
MRAVIQRCRSARVEVAGEVVGKIGHGLCAFVACGKGDGEAEASFMVDKILGLRIFEDAAGKMGKALGEISEAPDASEQGEGPDQAGQAGQAGGGLLIISQFTLYGDVRKGRRPSFDGALEPAAAERLLARVVELARARGARVETGRFRADMAVFVENDGPVTILIDSARVF